MKKRFWGIISLFLLFFLSHAALAEGLTLSRETLTLIKGKSERLIPQPPDPQEDNLRYVWSSSDSKVASVSNGLVFGKKPGSAEISCSAVLQDGTSVSAVCVIVVQQPVTGLRAVRKSVIVTEGEIRSVSAAATPADASNPAVIWESSDPTIAQITPVGFVRGISAGVCTALGTAADGSGKTVKAEITVEPRIPVAAINFSRHRADGSDNEFSVTLKSLTRKRRISSLHFTLSIDGKPQNSSFEFARPLPHGETDRDGWWKHYLLNLAGQVEILLTDVRYSDGRIDTFEDMPSVGSFTLKEGTVYDIR